MMIYKNNSSFSSVVSTMMAIVNDNGCISDDGCS